MKHIVLEILKSTIKPNKELYSTISPLTVKEDVFVHIRSLTVDTIISPTTTTSVINKGVHSGTNQYIHELFDSIHKNTELIIEVDRNKKGWVCANVITIN